MKKRLRTVKRGVVKSEITKPGTAHNDRLLAKQKKTDEALSGHLEPGKDRKNGFRCDDPDAEIPQHNWRQGPDFRSAFAGPDAGLACWGTSRPKQMYGGDAPTAPVNQPPPKAPRGSDGGYERLLRMSEQIVPFMANKRTKRRIKSKASTTAVGWGWT